MYRTSKETQERKDLKRQMILNTAARVFAERGYHNTSVKDIVGEAGVSVGSFYFYFKGKEELFVELYKSIVLSFQQTAERVLDVQNFTLPKNMTRVITANLWMYQCNRDIARIMLVEAVGLNPEFERERIESIRKSCRDMEQWFKRFKIHNHVRIPDERVAALAFESSFYYLVTDWLQSDGHRKLTDSAYAFTVYNLQALGIQFDNAEIKLYVEEALRVLEERA
ncbi:TetR/AcrR family transcriptional regulator [Paenibacillus tarimensis]|uniref:TetR/AcrR family transcriptional regulator n=1 Tax=Paenibacillus tarimensis TaxID=416012 RepID=UPI001F211A70|nr:TetR/AcrR family transcriptional regulator [Paenibacillus tarimensis]MCF2945415.1 TetR/AcrR family transcriptional regulator [Paenibacillus tarimensis]